MLKKLTAWLVCFGLSYVVQSFGWTGNAEAFMYIYLGYTTLLMVGAAIIFCLAQRESWTVKLGSVAMVILTSAAGILFAIGVTWLASKLFNVNFYVVYQVITFVMCFVKYKTKR